MNDDDIKHRAILGYGALARPLKKVDPAMADTIVHHIETAVNGRLNFMFVAIL